MELQTTAFTKHTCTLNKCNHHPETFWLQANGTPDYSLYKAHLLAHSTNAIIILKHFGSKQMELQTTAFPKHTCTLNKCNHHPETCWLQANGTPDYSLYTAHSTNAIIILKHFGSKQIELQTTAFTKHTCTLNKCNHHPPNYNLYTAHLHTQQMQSSS